MEAWDEVEVLARTWTVLYRCWWSVHYTTGILAAVAGAIVASGTGPIVWGSVASVCAALITFLGPLKKATQYYHAHHALSQVLLEARHGLLTDSQFAARVGEARRYVLGTEIVVTPAPEPEEGA